jgi:indole-3-glycerol phosphate synthase
VDPERQAELYARNGAAALSVVVEPDHFFGSYDLLARCRNASGLPVLAKDFVVDPRQLEWARLAGADAVLLIAAIFSDLSLRVLAAAARAMGLVPLIETHGPADMDLLVGTDWEVVGINNRDLRTFDVDLERSMAWVGSLPEDAVKVAESGLSRPEQLDTLLGAGFDAFLIGERLLLADDPGAALRMLVGPYAVMR